MIWEMYGSPNGLNFYLAFLAPPRSLFPPHSLPKEDLHPRSGISRSSDRRALRFANLQTGCQNHCGTSLLPTLEPPILGQLRSGVLPGWLWEGPGTESGGQRDSQKYLYVIHTLAPAQGAWCIQFTEEVSIGCSASPDRGYTWQSVLRGYWIFYKWIIRKHPEPWMNSSNISVPGIWPGCAAWCKILQDK